MVYLDYNATTPVHHEVAAVIHSALLDAWGNPSSKSTLGVSAALVINTARAHVADMLAARPQDIVFTSGGTEANNQVLFSALRHYHKSFPDNIVNSGKPHFVTSNIEHDSVKLVLDDFVKQQLADVTYVPVGHASGCLEADDVIASLTRHTVMVSVMTANNETGVIQPIPDICERVRAHNPRILLHTDAAQAIGKIALSVADVDCDYITIVGHKFYAPRIGAIFARDLEGYTPLYPMLQGGGQERGYRPGTENTAMIAGLGKAAQIVASNIDRDEKQLAVVRDYLEERLVETFGREQLHFNSHFEGSKCLPNTCNVSILPRDVPNVTGSQILNRCHTVQASVGAACHAHTSSKPSPILMASGVNPRIALAAVRLSVGVMTSQSDIDDVIVDLNQAVESLKSDARNRLKSSENDPRMATILETLENP